MAFHPSFSCYNIYVSRNGKIFPPQWNGSDFYVSTDVGFRARKEKQVMFGYYHEDVYYVTIDAGSTWIKGVNSYGFEKAYPKEHKVIKSAIDSYVTKVKKEKAKERAEKRKKERLEEAEKLGISVEDLIEAKKKERLVEKEHNAILRDVKDIENRSEIVAALLPIYEKSNLVIKKIRNDDNVRIVYLKRIQNTAKDLERFLDSVLKGK